MPSPRSRAVLPFLLACRVALALLLWASPALAVTEDYSADPGSPLNTWTGQNPATYGAFIYNYRNASQARVSNIWWEVGYGVGGSAALYTDQTSTLAGRELDIARSGGGAFNFTGIALCNYSYQGSSGDAVAVRVSVRGYRGGALIYDEGPVDVKQSGFGWTSYTPPAPFLGIDELRIVSYEGNVFDPSIDIFSYSLTTAATNAATGVSATGATLNGVVNAAGENTAAAFSYGLTTAYGSSVAATPGTVSGSTDTSIAAAITGLACGTTYHFQATGTAGGVTAKGADQSFTTSACNVAPSFVGATTTLTVPQNASATDIKALLHASDSDLGQTLTWSQHQAPDQGGALSFVGATASSGGTDIAPGGSITYTPAAGYLGSESFIVRVGDGEAQATRTITATSKQNQSISFANPGSQAFGSTPTLSATASASPVAFTSSTTWVCTITSGGALSFLSAGTCTINADQAGDATYAPAPQVSQSFQVTAIVPGAPGIGAATAGAGQASVAFSAPASTGGAAITSYTASSSPGGFTGTSATSPITVMGLTNGTAYSFTVTATSSAGTSLPSGASASVTPKGAQTINFANPGVQSYASPPTLTASTSSGLAASFSSGTTGVCTITGGGALSFISAGTCTISADQAGNQYYFPAPTVSQSFSVSAPSIAVSPAALPAATLSAAYSQTLAASGGIAPYSYAVTAGALPAGLSLAAGGSLSGTPSAQGSFSFTVTATDSHASHFTGARGYTLAVNPATPTAGAVSLTVAYNSGATAVPLVFGGGAATSVAVASAPSHGAAVAAGTAITYTPAAGYWGADSFAYTATNAGGTSAPAIVTVSVTPPLPVAGAVSVTVAVNSSANPIALSITGGAPTSVAVASAPSHGAASVSGTGIFYTPATGYLGADSFAYTATNAGGTSAPATVNIVVQARPDPSQDADVRAALTAQVDTASRFAKAQIGNFQSHLERLHVRPPTPGGEAQGSAQPTRGVAEAKPAAGGKAAPGSGTAANAGVAGSATPLGQALGTYLASAVKSLQSGKGSLAWPTLSLNNAFDDPLGTGLSIWTAGTITVGRTAGDSSFTTSGISAGSDFRVNEALVLGLGVGFGHESQSIGGSGTKSTGDGYSFMLYGSYQPAERFFVDGLVGYNSLQFKMQRYASETGTYAQSRREGAQWFLSLSSGYEYKTDALLLSPYGRVDLVSTQLNKSAESGAGAYNIVYFDQTTYSTKLSLGARGAVEIELENMKAKPFFRVEYQHDFAKPGVSTMAYVDQLSTGATFSYDMGSADHDTVVVGLGADFLFYRTWEFGLDYRISRSTATQTRTFGALLRKYITF